VRNCGYGLRRPARGSLPIASILDGSVVPDVINSVLVMSLSIVLLAILSGALILVMYWDGRWRRIPNFITLPLLVVGLFNGLLLNGITGVWQSLTGLLLGAGLMLPFFLLRAMGAGDVKLMAAVGAVLGLRLILTVFFLTSLCGGLLAAFLIIEHRVTLSFKHLPNLDDKRKTITVPYGWAIAAGTWLTIILHRMEELL
jgi:prepilin peptidase CpaA